MLDFAECAYDTSILKIICWYRNELTPFQLKGTNAYYIKQKYAVTHNFISKIINIIKKYHPDTVEIHSNIVFTNVELYPIIAFISNILKREQIRIHLYDDGIRSIGERYELDKIRSDIFPEVSNAHINYLKTILQDETNPFSDYLRESWPLLMNYLWHNFFNVTYHLMDWESSPHSPFQKHIQKKYGSIKNCEYQNSQPQKSSILSITVKLNKHHYQRNKKRN
nr:hypothetical protein [Citrobacter sp. Res13-Sevr-PEB04-36]